MPRDPAWQPPQWVRDAYALDVARWGSVSGGDEYIDFKDQGNAWHRENLPEITIVENPVAPGLMPSCERLTPFFSQLRPRKKGFGKSVRLSGVPKA